MDNLELLESDLNHVGKFIDGFESIIEKFKESNNITIDGCERYTIGVLAAEGIRFNNIMGSENFIIEAAKKLYEMIANMLKSIKEFFFGGVKVSITLKPVVSEVNKELQETNRKIDEFNKDTVMNLGPLSNDKNNKSITAAFNRAASSFNKKMEELEKYIEECKETLPDSIIKSIPLEASKSIKSVENINSALNMIKQLEVENVAAHLQTAIKELEKDRDRIKASNPSEEDLDIVKHLARAVKLLSEALAPMDKFINYCFESSIKKNINYSNSKLELIINCINAEHKK